MSCETQMFADLVVLSMTDTAAIQSIEYHTRKAKEGCGKAHAVVAEHLITALNNTYGIDSYDKYRFTNILPSQQ